MDVSSALHPLPGVRLGVTAILGTQNGLTLSVQRGQLEAARPCGMQCPMEGFWVAGTSLPVPLQCLDLVHTSLEEEEVHPLLPCSHDGSGR